MRSVTLRGGRLQAAQTVFAAFLVTLLVPSLGAQTGETIFTATSANVAEPGSLVKIRIQRWSTPEEATPLPTAALAQALGRAPTIGYLWTADVTGYSIKYAYRTQLPDGGERVILASDRRLGTHTAGWQPVVKEPLTDYEFTIIEIRLDGKGVGEGRTSLTTKVVVDADAKTVALESYQAAPAILRNVKRS
jgi:hypothetical protein